MEPFTIGIFLLSSVGSLFACRGGGEDEGDKGMLDPNNKYIWGGWEPPSGAKEMWNTWLENYLNQNQGKGVAYDPTIHGDKPYGHGIKGWPQDWGGLGPPMSGMAPPPWAYVPKNMGKPSYCYLPPLAGNCTNQHTRYGYNGYVDQCQSFVYTGCFGNRNNFEKLESCQEACMGNPESGCDNDSKIPVESFVWSRRCGYSDDQPSDYVEVRDY